LIPKPIAGAFQSFSYTLQAEEGGRARSAGGGGGMGGAHCGSEGGATSAGAAGTRAAAHRIAPPAATHMYMGHSQTAEARASRRATPAQALLEVEGAPSGCWLTASAALALLPFCCFLAGVVESSVLPAGLRCLRSGMATVAAGG
jgi:hypothetical protein